MGAQQDRYVKEIDAFIDAPKTLLSLAAPIWTPDNNGETKLITRLPIEINGELPGHSVVITSYSPRPPRFKISLCYGQAIVSRIDFVDTKRHSNELSAAQEFGLPFAIAGPHFHKWQHNRVWAAPNAHWALKFAEPLKKNIQQFEAAFREFCDQNNIQQPSQVFELPARSNLL